MLKYSMCVLTSWFIEKICGFESSELPENRTERYSQHWPWCCSWWISSSSVNSLSCPRPTVLIWLGIGMILPRQDFLIPTLSVQNTILETKSKVGTILLTEPVCCIMKEYSIMIEFFNWISEQLLTPYLWAPYPYLTSVLYSNASQFLSSKHIWTHLDSETSSDAYLSSSIKVLS